MGYPGRWWSPPVVDSRWRVVAAFGRSVACLWRAITNRRPVVSASRFGDCLVRPVSDSTIGQTPPIQTFQESRSEMGGADRRGGERPKGWRETEGVTGNRRSDGRPKGWRERHHPFKRFGRGCVGILERRPTSGSNVFGSLSAYYVRFWRCCEKTSTSSRGRRRCPREHTTHSNVLGATATRVWFSVPRDKSGHSRNPSAAIAQNDPSPVT